MSKTKRTPKEPAFVEAPTPESALELRIKASTPGFRIITKTFVEEALGGVEELSAREIRKCRERGVEPAKYARLKSESLAWRARRAGETDAAYDRRRRHHEALNFVRWLSRKLESLLRVADRDEFVVADFWGDRASAEAWILERMLESVEAARLRWQRDEQGDATALRVEAIRNTLERAREFGTTNVDRVRDDACELAPELRAITPAEWAGAMQRWPGVKRGGRRAKGVASGGWGEVVRKLLSREFLPPSDRTDAIVFTGAKDGPGLASGLAKKRQRRRRASRAKSKVKLIE